MPYIVIFLLFFSGCSLFTENDSISNRQVVSSQIQENTITLQGIVSSSAFDSKTLTTHILEQGDSSIRLKSSSVVLNEFDTKEVEVVGVFESEYVFRVTEIRAIQQVFQRETESLTILSYYNPVFPVHFRYPEYYTLSETKNLVHLLQGNERVMEFLLLPNTQNLSLELFMPKDRSFAPLVLSGFDSFVVTKENVTEYYTAVGSKVSKISIFSSIIPTDGETILSSVQFMPDATVFVSCDLDTGMLCQQGFRCELELGNKGRCVPLASADSLFLFDTIVFNENEENQPSSLIENKEGATPSGSQDFSTSFFSGNIHTTVQETSNEKDPQTSSFIDNNNTQELTLTPQESPLSGQSTSDAIQGGDPRGVSIPSLEVLPITNPKVLEKLNDALEKEVQAPESSLSLSEKALEEIEKEQLLLVNPDMVPDFTTYFATVPGYIGDLYTNNRLRYSIQFPKYWYWMSFGAQGGGNLWIEEFNKYPVEKLGDGTYIVRVVSGARGIYEEVLPQGTYCIYLPRDTESHFEVCGPQEHKITIQMMAKSLQQL